MFERFTEEARLVVVCAQEGAGARVLLEFGADSEKVQKQVIEMLASRPRPATRPPRVLSGHEARLSVDVDWFDGLSAALADLGREIRLELERDPDAGDLLL